MKYFLLFSLLISTQIFANDLSPDMGSFDVKQQKKADVGEDTLASASFGSYDLTTDDSRAPASTKPEKNWKQDYPVNEVSGSFR